MEVIIWDNHLKLENNDIYNFRNINPNSKKVEWCKIHFTLNEYGYLYCKLSNENKKKRSFKFHRLIFLFYNFDFDILNKKIIIDHIDRDKVNNSIENLRIVTIQQNAFNTNAKGYFFINKKWTASICINGKRLYLGRYYTEEEARTKYLEAKAIHHII